MDFLDFEHHDLYFDEPLDVNDEELLNRAANLYPSKVTEQILLELQTRIPQSLTVVVALYRFYYYQHRYQDALYIAARAMAISGAKVGLEGSWNSLTRDHIGKGVFVSMGLVQFYMLSLKASAYLLMRVGEIAQAHERLKKIVELDPADQFGAAFLYSIAEKELSAREAEECNVQSLYRY